MINDTRKFSAGDGNQFFPLQQSRHRNASLTEAREIREELKGFVNTEGVPPSNQFVMLFKS